MGVENQIKKNIAGEDELDKGHFFCERGTTFDKKIGSLKIFVQNVKFRGKTENYF